MIYQHWIFVPGADVLVRTRHSLEGMTMEPELINYLRDNAPEGVRTPQCPGDDVLEAYLDDELSESVLNQLRDHVRSCSFCMTRSVQICRETRDEKTALPAMVEEFEAQLRERKFELAEDSLNQTGEVFTEDSISISARIESNKCTLSITGVPDSPAVEGAGVWIFESENPQHIFLGLTESDSTISVGPVEGYRNARKPLTMKVKWLQSIQTIQTNPPKLSVVQISSSETYRMAADSANSKIFSLYDEDIRGIVESRDGYIWVGLMSSKYTVSGLDLALAERLEAGEENVLAEGQTDRSGAWQVCPVDQWDVNAVASVHLILRSVPVQREARE